MIKNKTQAYCAAVRMNEPLLLTKQSQCGGKEAGDGACAIYVKFRGIPIKTSHPGTSQDGVIAVGVAVMSGRGF